jgi:prolyl-tRNA editing enzyme YbaK/EbsC (Cys-tRNA(Pro) deacylase)
MEQDKFPLFITKLLDENQVKYHHINHGITVTMSEVAREANISYSSMAKTLVIMTPAGYISVTLSGDKRLSMEKLASVLHLTRNSIGFLPKKDFESIVGVPLGATSPFGVNMPLIIDKYLVEQDMIYCSCGTRVDIIGMKSSDFIKVSKGTIEDITE